MDAPFKIGATVRLVDATPAVGSKRRPAMPTGRDLVVDKMLDGGLRGWHVGVRGWPGLWRAERFEAA